MGNFFSIFCSDNKEKVDNNNTTISNNSNTNNNTNTKNQKLDDIDEKSLPPVTRDDVMIMNLKDKKIIRLPKSIRGNEFIVDNCEVFDY